MVTKEQLKILNLIITMEESLALALGVRKSGKFPRQVTRTTLL
jgi:hypothetical protein